MADKLFAVTLQVVREASGFVIAATESEAARIVRADVQGGNWDYWDLEPPTINTATRELRGEPNPLLMREEVLTSDGMVRVADWWAAQALAAQEREK